MSIRILNLFGYCFLVFGVCFAPAAQAAVMSSGSYKIQIDSVNVGGGRGTSSSYALEQTSGEVGTERLTGSSNNLWAGFQLPVVAAPSPAPAPTPTPSKPAGSNAGTRRSTLYALENVQDFTATGRDGSILLRWKNPADIDFQGVRILRAQNFYPANPDDGLLIYEGAREKFLDEGLENGKGYYYTAFAYDRFGNFSSGAVVFAVPVAPSDDRASAPSDDGAEPPLVPPELIPPGLRDLSLLDFDFIQNGTELPVIQGRVEARADAPITISIDYDKLPEVLKTILVTMRNEKGEVFSFLLRVDEEKQRYLATLRPPASGLYPVNFTVVDYKNQGLQKVEGELQVKEALGAVVSPPVDQGFGKFLPRLLIFLLIALILLALWVGVRLRRNTNNQETRYKQYPITNHRITKYGQP